ncbi:MAG TPA: uL15m family ribosomal protein [Candidatus Paceibacterota bacterium]|nr:uL15m family ribosomal protein [Candidatus Paceibacterota bacterium]
MASLNELTRTDACKATRVGRGGRRGKTSGRGTKGQKARAGHSIRPALRDVIKKLPKLRGHGMNRARTVNSGRPVHQPVTLETLNAAFAAGETVSPATLVEKGVLRARGGKLPAVVIVAGGELSAKLAVERCRVTKTAKAAIEAAGGSIAK